MYDSTEDTLEHIQLVQSFIENLREHLYRRGWMHDLSKLEEPEKSLYDEFKPKIQEVELEYGYGSPQYEKLIKELEPAFQHHFSNNRHHPEYFENGINGMTLIDLVEMFCDWKAAASRYNKSPNIKANQRRFGMSDQLAQIFENTIKELGW